MPESPALSPGPPLSERLQDTTEALAAARSREEVFGTVLRPALEALGALTCTVLLLEDDGRQLRRTATLGAPLAERTLWRDTALARNDLIRSVLEQHQGVFFRETQELRAAYPQLERRMDGEAALAVAVLPLVLDGAGLGVIVLDFAAPHEFPPEERRFLRTLSAQCSIALGRTFLTHELESRVQARTRQLEQATRAQLALSAFTEAAGTELDVRVLARQAVEFLKLRFPECSSGYYALEDDLWKLRVHTDDMQDDPALLRRVQAGLPLGTPVFRDALLTRQAVFVSRWDAVREGVEGSEAYEAVAVYPLLHRDAVRAMLVVGLKHAELWEERDQDVFRAVGRGLTLALERAAQADALVQKNAELEARTSTLEAFARLTSDLGTQPDPPALIGRAQGVALSLLPGSTASFQEAPTGAGSPATPTYAPDGPRGAVAALPVRVAGELLGVLSVTLPGPHPWTRTDRAVLETLVGSLELALGQAEQAQRHEEEVRAQAAFVRFMEATGSIQDLGTLIREVLQTLQALLPGSGAAFYDRAPDGWTLRQQIGTISAPLTVPLLPDSLPIARLLTERSPLFVEGRDHPSGRPLALYPLQQHHEVTAVLSVSGPDRRPWTDRERTLVSAIGRSFSLLHDRIALAERLQDRQQEAERRMEALEAFAQLTNELGIQGDRYALVQRAQAVVLSLLDDGFAVYYEPDGPVWRLRSQVGSMRNPALQAAVDAGLDFERTENLLRPWRTGEALYQDAYDTGTDALDETKHTVGATATVPLRLDGHCIGVFGIVQFGPRRWTATDRTVLEGVLRSLSLALERAQSISQLAERSRELEHSNAGLRAANEELEAFAYSVSHDLRTPVRHILGFNSLLRRSLQHSDLDSKAVRYLDVVDQSAGRMNTLIDTMLELSRTSRQPLRMQPVDLNAMLDAVRQELAPEMNGRHVQWEARPLPTVMGDHAMLRQVLVNLLTNALKYTQPRDQARIEVWADGTDREWTVHVRDNGVGFNPQYASKLFGVFQRLHSQEEFEGVGIGLANVRRIVTRHGGRVHAEGTQGEGATFSFTLPRT